MNQEQRGRIEQRLHEERERAIRRLDRHDDDAQQNPIESGELSAYPQHMADQGTEAYEREMDSSLAQRDTRVVALIDEALRRLIDDPEGFGHCEKCGNEIAFERLDLVPWTRRCADHAAS